MEKDIIQQQWFRISGETVSDLQEAIKSQIQKNRAMNVSQKVWIGTDSQVHDSDGTITIVTSIAIIRERRGGNGFIHKQKIKKKMTIKERMLFESHRSITIAVALQDLLRGADIDLEIHADINTNIAFKSNIAYNDAKAAILAMGFNFKAKPDALGASYISNKFTKN